MTTLGICKYCGKGIEWRSYSRYINGWVHVGTGKDFCHRPTFAEPEQTDAQRDLHELQEPSGERSEFWEDESTARALLRIVIQLAEQAGLV